jgi:hypothetical protein
MSEADDELWVDDQAGPVVRPFTVARGRAQRTGEVLDLIAVVLTAEVPMPDPMSLGPEDEAILEFCIRPQSVADIAVAMALPVGVVRVLLGDLSDRGLIGVRHPTPTSAAPDARLLREVIDGLRAL